MSILLQIQVPGHGKEQMLLERSQQVKYRPVLPLERNHKKLLSPEANLV